MAIETKKNPGNRSVVLKCLAALTIASLAAASIIAVLAIATTAASTGTLLATATVSAWPIVALVFLVVFLGSLAYGRQSNNNLHRHPMEMAPTVTYIGVPTPTSSYVPILQNTGSPLQTRRNIHHQVHVRTATDRPVVYIKSNSAPSQSTDRPTVPRTRHSASAPHPIHQAHSNNHRMGYGH